MRRTSVTRPTLPPAPLVRIATRTLNALRDTRRRVTLRTLRPLDVLSRRPLREMTTLTTR
jgi:hypothetical protein